MGFPGGSKGKESTCDAGDLGLRPGWEDPQEEGMATHSSILAWRIPRDRGAWWATVHGVAKSIKCVANTLFSVRGLSFYFTYIAYFDE